MSKKTNINVASQRQLLISSKLIELLQSLGCSVDGIKVDMKVKKVNGINGIDKEKYSLEGKVNINISSEIKEKNLFKIDEENERMMEESPLNPDLDEDFIETGEF